MAKLKDEAKAWEPKTTKNIADLEVVSIGMEIYEGTGTTKEGKDFSYKYLSVNGAEYRVPESVLEQLKTILEEKPNLTHFKVKKIGEGLNTKYTVIPMGD